MIWRWRVRERWAIPRKTCDGERAWQSEASSAVRPRKRLANPIDESGSTTDVNTRHHKQVDSVLYIQITSCAPASFRQSISAAVLVIDSPDFFAVVDCTLLG